VLFSLRLVLTVGLLLVSSKSWAVHRVAVLVTAKKGIGGELPLAHVEEDAARLEETLRLMGNFAPGDIHRLDDVAPDKVFKKLTALEDSLSRIKEETLLLFYYSGHGDDESLHLMGETLAHTELRERLEKFPARLKIGIIDSCSSGAIIGKGSLVRAAFKVKIDDSLKMKGTVILTSSRGDELSLALPFLKGSIFSHHLSSGLRGAADEDADGKVSLNEAYHYAYLRTRDDTEQHEQGEQLPQIKSLDVVGEGPVTLTWLKMARASLALPPGREVCFITNADEERLIAEGHLEPARELHMALKPASYVLKCRQKEGRLIRKASFSMVAGELKRADTLPFVEESRGEILRKGGPENLEQLCSFDISAQSIYVERNQRTNVVNLEGLLELRGRFSADDVTTAYYPSSSTVVTARLGETLRMNQFVTRVTIDKTGSVPLGAELWEVEYGAQGMDDYGSQRGSIHLDCARTSDVVDLPIPISADTLLEKSGSVIVRYSATRR
jgi:hypothetical protein